MSTANAFLAARDFLLAQREDYARAVADFRWPELATFNWALDYFDALAAGNARIALWCVDEGGAETRQSFAELSARSNRVANFLRPLGVRRGDRILIMLGNTPALWEVTLAAMKLGAVISPATTLLPADDVRERIARAGMRHVITDVAGAAKLGETGDWTRVVVGGEVAGWRSYEDADAASEDFQPDGPTAATAPFLLYFTSGTTAKPKLVLHTHQSYPVGHLSTMYWLGVRPDDVHLNISSPGWAKHAWSSFFAPWNAGATILVYNQARFDAKKTLATVVRCGATSLCAPPTVWRALILEDLASYPVRLREAIGAGEPLNPEVIERVRAAWGLTLRDGYGQTETACLIGNSPGQPVKTGSMGRPMPGYRIALLDRAMDEECVDAVAEGEIGIRLSPAPTGLMSGYVDDAQRIEELVGKPFYRTSDVATRDAEGYYWYVGRADDVFKSSDYRISPFELESALLEHGAVAEAAVVPSPDARRLAVPKAFVTLKPGVEPTRSTALELFTFLRRRLAPYQRIRRLEFGELPKTVSGKIRRVELRRSEAALGEVRARAPQEFWEEDL